MSSSCVSHCVLLFLSLGVTGKQALSLGVQFWGAASRHLYSLLLLRGPLGYCLSYCSVSVDRHCDPDSL